MDSEKSNVAIKNCRNLGPKSAEWLAAVGINTLEELREYGAINTYLAVEKSGKKISLILLYALHGAINNHHWNVLSKSEKATLIEELEGARAFLSS